MMKNITIVLLIITILFVFSCEGLWQVSPNLDNKFDPENPDNKDAAISRDGLVAEYLFTGNTDDTSGNVNNLTGSPGSFGEDRHGTSGGAINFNGSSNDLIIPDNGFSHYETNNKSTISFWIKTADAEGYIFSYFADNVSGWEFKVSSSFTFKFESGEHYSILDSWSNDLQSDITHKGQWNHVLIANTGLELEFYLNGFKNDSTFSCSNLAYGEHAEAYFYIGAYNLSGVMDDVRIYNRNLTESEMAGLLTEGLTD